MESRAPTAIDNPNGLKPKTLNQPSLFRGSNTPFSFRSLQLFNVDPGTARGIRKFLTSSCALTLPLQRDGGCGRNSRIGSYPSPIAQTSSLTKAASKGRGHLKPGTTGVRCAWA